MNYRLLIFLCFVPCSLWAKNNVEYTLSFADSLRKKADAIVNYSHTHYTLNAVDELYLNVEKVLTIFSDRGDEFSDFVIGYDAESEVKSLSCTILDENNKVIRKLKKKDFKDFSNFDGFTLFSDNRLKHWSAKSSNYPLIIKVNYEIKYNGFTAIPRWIPQDDYRLAVHEAKLTFDFPESFKIRHKSIQSDKIFFSSKKEENRNIYSWKVDNLSARIGEPFSPSLTQQVPIVMIAPLEFEYDGYGGSSESWASIGEWNYGLLPSESALTEATMLKLDELKLQSKNNRELARRVYEYAQSRTRYVGIQLGIGGWKPFPSLTVDELGYGDCKALSLYIKTMLHYVGIEAIYTVIGAGGLKISHLDFPSKNQTNHVILCVPIEADTIWLECTSQTEPFNHLSADCTNRHALLIKAEGGEMVFIPQRNENVQVRESRIHLLGNGVGEVEYQCQYIGVFFDVEKSIHQLSQKELSDYLVKNLPVSDIQLSQYATQINPDKPELLLKASFKANNISTAAGDRIFVELSPFAKLNGYGKQKDKRRNPVYVPETMEFRDRIVFRIPEGYSIEHQPDNAENISKYGNYNFELSIKDDNVIVNRSFKVKKGNYPKEAYEPLIDYLNEVAESDECKLILKRN